MVTPYKRISIIITVIVMGFITYGIVFLLSAKNTDIKNNTPMYKLDASTLNTIINHNSITIHPEDIIEFRGYIEDINYLNNRTNILLHLNDTTKTFVICDMQSGQIQKIASLKKYDTINVKGIYKGVLKDVILLNCIITE